VNHAKYILVAIIPNLKKGSSTGFIPNHVKIIKIIIKVQKEINFISFLEFC
jgi:hypothetical protein